MVIETLYLCEESFLFNLVFIVFFFLLCSLYLFSLLLVSHIAETDSWNAAEVEQFCKSILVHDKDFFKVAKDVGVSSFLCFLGAHAGHMKSEYQSKDISINIGFAFLRLLSQAKWHNLERWEKQTAPKIINYRLSVITKICRVE